MAFATDSYESSMVYMYSPRFGVDAGQSPRAGLPLPSNSLKWYAINGIVDKLSKLMVHPSFNHMLKTNGEIAYDFLIALASGDTASGRLMQLLAKDDDLRNCVVKGGFHLLSNFLRRW